MVQAGEFLIGMLEGVLYRVALAQFNDFMTRNVIKEALSKAFPLVKVVCDDILNTPERINKNELWFSLEYLETKIFCKYCGKEVTLEKVS